MKYQCASCNDDEIGGEPTDRIVEIEADSAYSAAEAYVEKHESFPEDGDEYTVAVRPVVGVNIGEWRWFHVNVTIETSYDANEILTDPKGGPPKPPSE